MVGCSITRESTESGNGSSEAVHPTSNYSAETTPEPSYDISEEVFNLTWNSLLLNYYNSYEGHMALGSDFEDLAGEGMSVQIDILQDDHMVVTVWYEDRSLLIDGIEETLAQQLDSMTSRIEEQMHLYNTEIIGPASVRVIEIRYVDLDGNVLAKQSWSGQ